MPFQMRDTLMIKTHNPVHRNTLDIVLGERGWRYRVCKEIDLFNCLVIDKTTNTIFSCFHMKKQQHIVIRNSVFIVMSLNTESKVNNHIFPTTATSLFVHLLCVMYCGIVLQTDSSQ